MPTVRPNQVFTGYTSDGTNITIPIASLPKLTAAAAHATTGNAADLLWGLIDASYEAIQSLSQEARSTNFTIAKGTQGTVPNVTDARQQPYTFSVRLRPTGLEVLPDA